VLLRRLLIGNRNRNLRRTLQRVSLGAALAALVAIPARPQNSSADLANESLEDLMNIRVTSVSKQEQKVSRTAAAIFVITAEDIRRSGATNIPDLLRMVPGVDVAQINANTWAISVRRFNGRYSNELLVMVDGRTVYTPTFGGVFWDVLDLPLEDIERIEVIRGPGGSVWGTNAVNGVINIITKSAAETRGAMVETADGNLDEGSGTLQYGGALGAKTNYRVYTKYLNQDHMPGQGVPDDGDGWHVLRGGFRADTAFSSQNALTIQGDVYSGREGQQQPYLASITSPDRQLVESGVGLSGGFVQAIWNHTFSARADTSLQISYQRYKRNDILSENRETLDIDFQNHFLWGDRQNVVWGFDYRDSYQNSIGTLTGSLNPPNLDIQLFSSFVQDEVAFAGDRLHVTAGVKVEHDHYNGFSAMPSVSAVWAPSDTRAFWVSISRAVQTPSAFDASVRSDISGFTGPGGTPTLVSFFGNPDIKNTDLMAYEVGYRTTLNERVSVDFAAYFNHYSDLHTIEPATPFFEETPAPPHLVLPETYENLMFGETHGLEIYANWKVMDRWTLSPGYALEQIHMHLSPGSQDTTSVGDAEGSSPANSAQLRSHVVLPRGLAWDASLFFVDRIADPMIPAYTRFDTGLAWQWKGGVVVNLVGQNLVQDRHLEYADVDASTQTSLIKRSVYAKITWSHQRTTRTSKTGIDRRFVEDKMNMSFLFESSGRSAGRQRKRIGRWRAAFCVAMLAAVLVSPCAPARAQASPSAEYQVKAAFLLNFARFIEWPADAYAGANAPITFCLFRPDPFGSALDEMTQGKSIDNRSLVVRHVQELPDLKSCQMVFVGDGAEKQLPEILGSLKGSSALVVGESDGFAERGGGIQFYLQNSEVRFSVNVDATKRARLAVSSKLLAFARIVHDANPQKGI
jgi:iron complex outermembrane receptor protein